MNLTYNINNVYGAAIQLSLKVPSLLSILNGSFNFDIVSAIVLAIYKKLHDKFIIF